MTSSERRDSIHREFNIAEVAQLCGIRVKHNTNKAEVRCHCPFCGNDRGKPTASLNTKLGLFHCFRCGEGCNSISLYAKVCGIENKEAYKKLIALNNAA